jgi:hypothetical protein
VRFAFDLAEAMKEDESLVDASTWKTEELDGWTRMVNLSGCALSAGLLVCKRHLMYYFIYHNQLSFITRTFLVVWRSGIGCVLT